MSDQLTSPIRCRQLAVGYGNTPVLEEISFSLEAADTLALVGRSGCGKTTLLKTLAGILDPLGGEATVLGARLPASPPAGELGYIPQSLGLVMHGTVMSNVLHGTLADLGRMRSFLGRFPEDSKLAARTAIDQVGLSGMEHKRVAELSGGQRRRVAIARALVQEPKLLLADEILSELDQETAGSIVDCLDRLQDGTGMTILIVEHNVAVAQDISDRLFRVESGQLHEYEDATEAHPNP